MKKHNLYVLLTLLLTVSAGNSLFSMKPNPDKIVETTKLVEELEGLVEYCLEWGQKEPRKWDEEEGLKILDLDDELTFEVVREIMTKISSGIRKESAKKCTESLQIDWCNEYLGELCKKRVKKEYEEFETKFAEEIGFVVRSYVKKFVSQKEKYMKQILEFFNRARKSEYQIIDIEEDGKK